MLNLIYSLRPVNLLLVCFSQLVFYYLVITPSVHTGLRLSNGLLYAFILCTILITAAGYLINDYFDHEVDRFKDSKKRQLDKITLLSLYYIISLSGFFLALFIAWSLGNLWLSLIYLLAMFLLYLYSSHLKSTFLWGNILVAVFSALVFLILILAEWPAIESLKISDIDEYHVIISLMSFFGLFAFTISMVREIVKDIEDMDSDILAGIKTLPITLGIGRAKVIAAFFGIILLIVLLAWFYDTRGFNGEVYYIIIYFLTLIIPVLYLVSKCLISKAVSDFRFISQLSRIIMFLGLFFLILYAWN